MSENKRIKLRKVSNSDSKIIWHWRNEPKVRKYFFNSAPVSWNEHQKWFIDRLKDPLSKIYIATYRKKKIGVIRFQIQKSVANVSVNLNPKYLGKGLGQLTIKQGTKKFFTALSNKTSIVANIKKGNIASQKAFKKAGYNLIKRKKNFVVYQYSNREWAQK